MYHRKDDLRRVPKRELLRPLVSALESGRLRIAKGPHAEALLPEMRAFRVCARSHVAHWL